MGRKNEKFLLRFCFEKYMKQSFVFCSPLKFASEILNEHSRIVLFLVIETRDVNLFTLELTINNVSLILLPRLIFNSIRALKTYSWKSAFLISWEWQWQFEYIRYLKMEAALSQILDSVMKVEHTCTQSLYSINIWDTLCDFVPYVQF